MPCKFVCIFSMYGKNQFPSEQILWNVLTKAYLYWMPKYHCSVSNINVASKLHKMPACQLCARSFVCFLLDTSDEKIFGICCLKLLSATVTKKAMCYTLLGNYIMWHPFEFREWRWELYGVYNWAVSITLPFVSMFWQIGIWKNIGLYHNVWSGLYISNRGGQDQFRYRKHQNKAAFPHQYTLGTYRTDSANDVTAFCSFCNVFPVESWSDFVVKLFFSKESFIGMAYPYKFSWISFTTLEVVMYFLFCQSKQVLRVLPLLFPFTLPFLHAHCGLLVSECSV